MGSEAFEIVIFALLVLASLPAAWHLLRARQISHITLFSAGYLYYFVLPVLIGVFPLASAQSNAAYEKWAAIFSDLPSGRLVAYSISILVYYLCFRLGDLVAAKLRNRVRLRVSPSLAFVSPLYVCTFVLAVAYIYHLRWAIGINYGDTLSDIVAKGTLTAISLVLLGLALLKTSAKERPEFLPTIFNRWMCGYFLVATILILMGERLYFVTSLLLLVSYRSLYFKQYTRKQLMAYGAGLAVLGGAVGIMRLGAGISSTGLLLNLAYEPLFTSFSLVSFLALNHIPWIEYPRFLLGDFLNLVPTVILPNKINLLPNPALAGFSYVSPLGAMSSWVSFIVNFGLTGTALVMFLIGYFFRWLFIQSRWPVFKTMYLLSSSFLVFAFFRDPFSVSLVKNIFEFSLCVPMLCALLSGLMSWSSRGVDHGYALEARNG